jgi:lipoate-protein ligase A
MRYLDLTLPTPAENLALDEALLDEAELAGCPTETLRLWEPRRPMVVVGRSSRIDAEVHRQACRRRGIPILRRCSGGAAIVTGPGCLMYALVLSYQWRPVLRAVDCAHRFVLGTLASALRPLVPDVACRGTSDLAMGQFLDRSRDAAVKLPVEKGGIAAGSYASKCSGNSMRCKRDHLLYHGTLLYDFPLELIEECLAMPPREPDYREGRSHEAFVANLPLAVSAIREALVTAWDASEAGADWPRVQTARLVAEKYSRPEWNEKH